MIGVRRYRTKAGFLVFSLHYSADPDKRSPAWKKQAMRGMDMLTWQREYELNWSSVSGLPVFATFFDAQWPISDRPLEWNPQVPITRGWDFGLMPACVYTQFLPSGQWIVLAEMQGEHTGIRSLCRLVKERLLPRFPGARYRDFCDPSGFARSQTDEKTCVQIIHEELGGWPMPGAIQWEHRRDAMNEWLRREIDGYPGFVLDPSCGILRRGF